MYKMLSEKTSQSNANGGQNTIQAPGVDLEWRQDGPVVWGPYTTFQELSGANQGRLWVGRSMEMKRAFVKVHSEPAAYQRELSAYKRFQGLTVSPQLLGALPARKALLIADAGLSNPPQTPQLIEGLIDCLHQLSAITVPQESLSTREILTRRWSRMLKAVGAFIPTSLADWISNEIEDVGTIPKGVVHRDLRPNNLCAAGEVVQLIDFGQSRVDFVVLDAVPFFAGHWAENTCEAVLSDYRRRFPRGVLDALPLFATLYFMGSYERSLLRNDAPLEHRDFRLLKVLAKHPRVPVNLNDFFSTIP